MSNEKKKQNELKNNVFAGLPASKVAELQKETTRDPRIRLCSTYMTGAREVVPIAEALVAWDPVNGDIVKFVAAFIPGSVASGHLGVKFMISKHADGKHKPVIVNAKPESEQRDGYFWNPHFLSAHLDYGKLPVTVPHVEWRVLRAYRHDLSVRYRFELLAFEVPVPGIDVDKKTMFVERMIPRIPPIKLANVFKGLQWWQTKILEELSMFCGEDLTVLGIERELQQKVETGTISEEQKKEMLEDHSEEGRTESLAASIGLPPSMMETPEEGRPFADPSAQVQVAMFGGIIDKLNEEDPNDAGPDNVLAAQPSGEDDDEEVALRD